MTAPWCSVCGGNHDGLQCGRGPIPERKGSLIRWRAECGHWMVTYSLEPTPPLCPDCADKDRNALEKLLSSWARDLSRAVTVAEDCYFGDVVGEDLTKQGITAPDETVAKMQIISDRVHGALADLEQSERELRALAAALPPKAERLSIPEPAVRA
jgi:hypothetical protein